MAMQEIDELTLKQYQQQGTFLQKALSNPKTREALLRLEKELNPNTVIPEIDARDAVLEEVKKLSGTMTDLQKEISDQKAAAEAERNQFKLNQQWSAGRKKAAQQGYDGEALEALEKFMEEKGIAEHDLAIPAFEKFHPQASPVASSSNKFDIFNRSKAGSDDLMKKLYSGDDDGFLATAVDDTLKQMRGLAA